MTQSIIEKLEALHKFEHGKFGMKHTLDGDYVLADDLRAIIEDAKAEKQEPLSVLALKNTELSKRVAVLEDLLSSAYTIANRKGIDTHWFRFCAQLHINGISPVTAKTFKILPSDPEYTTPQPDIVAELVKALEPIGQRFLSGNDVPVSRATVPAEEWKAVQDVLAKAKEMM